MQAGYLHTQSEDSGITHAVVKSAEVRNLENPGSNAGPYCEYKLLTFILAPTAPTSLRLRRSI